MKEHEMIGKNGTVVGRLFYRTEIFMKESMKMESGMVMVFTRKLKRTTLTDFSQKNKSSEFDDKKSLQIVYSRNHKQIKNCLG